MFKLRITGDIGFEFWQDIPKYEGEYQASTYGRIKSNDLYRKHWPTGIKIIKGQILKGFTDKDGYYRVFLTNRKNCLISRLVADTFMPNPENKPQIDHIDTDKSNNKVENLRWVSPKENNNNPITVCNRKKLYSSKRKPVEQYDKNMILIQQFNSLEEAGSVLGISPIAIGDCCRGKHKSCGGFIFKFI